MSPVLVALLLTILAATGYLEWRRADRRRLAWRIAAVVLASVLFVLLIDPPHARAVPRADLALLITDGARPDQLRRLGDSLRPAASFRLGDSLPDLRTLERRHPALSDFVIVGWGADSTDLPGLSRVRASFSPAPIPAGVIALDAPRDIALGNEVLLRGRVAGTRTVRLDAGAGAVDSATADSSGRFTLRARPRAAGLVRYVVHAAGRADTLAVFVRNERPPRLLLLRSGPSFEASRLRDWLAARAGTVLAHTDVSRGRTRVERWNVSGERARPLTPGLLDSFDILWADARVIGTLSSAERNVLAAAVDSGLGLIVDAGALASLRNVLGERLPEIAAAGEPRTLRLRWESGSSLAPIPAAVNGPGVPAGSRTLAADERGRSAVLWTPVGQGAVVTTLVARPSRWMLEGERGSYDTYWSGLLGAARRPRARWELSGWPARPDYPLTVRRAESGSLVGTIEAPSGAVDTVYLAPGPDGASGRYWPRVPGRHVLRGAGDSLEFDVASPAAWPALRAAARHEATGVWAATGPSGGRRGAMADERQPIPRTWIFVGLLAAIGYLWWERRMT